jgi:hypothetical protein
MPLIKSMDDAVFLENLTSEPLSERKINAPGK